MTGRFRDGPGMNSVACFRCAQLLRLHGRPHHLTKPVDTAQLNAPLANIAPRKAPVTL